MSETKEQLIEQVNSTVAELEDESGDALLWLEENTLGVEELCYTPRGELSDFRVLICIGGPHIEVNAARVEGYWGGESFTRSYADNIGLWDAIEEIYGNQR